MTLARDPSKKHLQPVLLHGEVRRQPTRDLVERRFKGLQPQKERRKGTQQPSPPASQPASPPCSPLLVQAISSACLMLGWEAGLIGPPHATPSRRSGLEISITCQSSKRVRRAGFGDAAGEGSATAAPHGCRSEPHRMTPMNSARASDKIPGQTGQHAYHRICWGRFSPRGSILTSWRLLLCSSWARKQTQD